MDFGKLSCYAPLVIRYKGCVIVISEPFDPKLIVIVCAACHIFIRDPIISICIFNGFGSIE